MRLRLGTTIALALLVGGSLAGSSAGAHPSGILPLRAQTAGPQRSYVSKFPWDSAPAHVVPRQIVVVWKAGARSVAERALSVHLGTRRIAPTPELGVDVVHVPMGRSVNATLRALQRSPLVRSAEPNRIASIAAPPPPNDSHFGEQWALNNIGQPHTMTDQGGGTGTHTNGTADADVDAPEAWADQPVHHPVVVAVIDTGVDIGHPDLSGRLWENTAEKTGVGVDGVDDDGNGFIDDVNGWDFKDNDPNPTPTNNLENSHGTHLAGIVAAEQNNTLGVSGVCPDCQIMALRIGTASSLTLGAEVKAINYAIHNGADVINLSLGSDVWSKAERAAINKAGRHGVLVVIAAGNASSDNDIQFYASDPARGVASAPSYPASYSLKNILSVAATNDRDNYAYFSQCRRVVALWKCGFTNWGHDSVDVAAPGVDILSTVKRGQGDTFADYEYFDGTSMASPLVAGIAGLVLSGHSSYSAVQVKNAIMHSVDRPSSLKLYDSWGDVTGVGKKALSGRFTRTFGRVNADAAVLTTNITNATPSTDGNIDGARLIRGKRTGSLSWPSDANDVYRKRLTKGTKYHVALNGPKGKDLDLWVWRPGTKEIFQFTPGCFHRGGSCPALQAVSGGMTADEALTFKAPKTGVFYIHVNGWYSGGSYSLTIKKV